MTADLSALVAAVERAIREIPSAHANLPSLTKQFNSDRALLSRLAANLRLAKEGYWLADRVVLQEKHQRVMPAVLILPWDWEER